jgi:hypothetical protein
VGLGVFALERFDWVATSSDTSAMRRLFSYIATVHGCTGDGRTMCHSLIRDPFQRSFQRSSPRRALARRFARVVSWATANLVPRGDLIENVASSEHHN